MINDRLFKYLDNQLSDLEKASFELEIQSNPQLAGELEKYRKFFADIKIDNNAEPLPAYFNSVVPEFRNRLENTKPGFFSIKYAVATFAVVVMFAAALFIYYNNSTPIIESMVEVENITKEMTGDEIAQSIKVIEKESAANLDVVNSNAEISETEVDEMIYAEIDISQEAVTDNLSTYEFNTLLESTDEKEADLVYSELLQKDFLAKDN